jgi:protein TonB
MFAGLEVAQDAPERRWTAMLSFTVQAALVATALVFPLLRPENLPDSFAHRLIFAPASGPDVRVTANPQSAGSAGSTVVASPIIVRRGTFHFRNTPVQTPGTVSVPDIGPGDPRGQIMSVLSTVEAVGVPAPPVPAPEHRSRQSVIMTGNLIHRVEPQYPSIAIRAGIQGTVFIRALIGRDGTIENAHVVGGSPLLARAALDAVMQWKYRPYYLNGEPIEVETQITVNFVLSR